ncbi:hypothetical protein GOP47_0000776 [Adiantum capillus-veneris]|uniref:Fe2OG dioxygenase domain-containing protein n=1 Tax=Adiantum capillus-veneris TaxID=13818 RepID=A0A9D4ZT88_ADICA|nr:hypothetical protein GOP47_0000776 [Adiantum capillus-veneris]
MATQSAPPAFNQFSACSPSPPPPHLIFDPSFLSTIPSIPPAFIWPEAASAHDQHASTPSHSHQFIEVPIIDLAQFRNSSTSQTVANLASQASSDIGFFHIVNHGVSQSLIEEVHAHTQGFFDLSLATKQKAGRFPGESFGYASSFTGRFSSRLPWKETMSLQPSPVSNISSLLEKVLGDEHRDSSKVLEEYSKEMIRVGLEVMEVLAMGLGLDRTALRRFFELPDNSSILRLNYYPPCQQPGLTFGTGPHTDPTALTILHQDNVAGLQVLHNGAWFTVSPRPDAFVVNIGDTLMALTNQRYKSCVHRALVNSKTARRSMAFFFNPGFNITLSAPEQLVDETNPRAFHDFTWAKFLFFTQSVHRSGVNTLHSFNSWLAAQT